MVRYRKCPQDMAEEEPCLVLPSWVFQLCEENLNAGIKHPQDCRFCRRPPGRGRGRYSTRDSIFCLAEPRWRRYHQACAKWSSSRRRSIGRARRSWCRTAIPRAFIVCATSITTQLIPPDQAHHAGKVNSVDRLRLATESVRLKPLETLAVPMFLFMLTAREGRVSANGFALRLRCCLRRAIVAPPAHLCVSRRLPPGRSGDKATNPAGVLYRH